MQLRPGEVRNKVISVQKRVLEDVLVHNQGDVVMHDLLLLVPTCLFTSPTCHELSAGLRAPCACKELMLETMQYDAVSWRSV